MIKYYHDVKNDLNITYFCSTPLNKGEFVCGPFKHEDYSYVEPFKSCQERGKILGMSLSTVVSLDDKFNWLRNNHVPLGGKIELLKYGEVTIMLPKQWKVPAHQPLYLNEKGKITWRRSSYRIGSTLEDQEDAWVKMVVNII